MTEEELFRLEELGEKATPRPWYVVSERDENEEYIASVNGNGRLGNGGYYTVNDRTDCTGWNTDSGLSGYGLAKEDAEYVVAACNAVPALIARIRELKTELKALNDNPGCPRCGE